MHRKELPSQDKTERKVDVKFKPAGEEQGHRGRVDRALPPHPKNDVKHYGFNKYHPEERRGREDCKNLDVRKFAGKQSLLTVADKQDRNNANSNRHANAKGGKPHKVISLK